VSGSRKSGRAAVPRSPDQPSNAKRPTKDGAARQSPATGGRPAEIKEDAPPYRTAAPSTAQRAPSPPAGEKDGMRGQVGQGSPLRFIDLFCGIGGFRFAFERAGARCVFSSDWDKYSRQTYAANFGEEPHGDIHSVAVADIPPHDILCGGFPCQPFSLAGVSKKNSLGRKHGFQDEKQGNLFFSIAEILDYHKPAAFVLENVKNLRSHDGGRCLMNPNGIPSLSPALRGTRYAGLALSAAPTPKGLCHRL
jgi:hypothetical protein